ncbi:hypothetical protein [Parachryseolinea silvisoli]|jgi:hypothetical protein|uniref:hypothetical protein n=1 Tax=Parachryseolinea silvisoli TaxID=2873601 RepID=UPI002265AC0F|nr:hypothetical protein [Parachryseolinea silvisoli]MCD9019092.1 hypothetical protein [Parachryseolinea silvisoli]
MGIGGSISFSERIAVEKEDKVYKRRFNSSLEPMKVMLVDLRHTLTPEAWMALVQRTRESVVRNPDQYIEGSNDLPPGDGYQRIISLIFDEFLHDCAIR